MDPHLQIRLLLEQLGDLQGQLQLQHEERVAELEARLDLQSADVPPLAKHVGDAEQEQEEEDEVQEEDEEHASSTTFGEGQQAPSSCNESPLQEVLFDEAPSKSGPSGRPPLAKSGTRLMLFDEEKSTFERRLNQFDGLIGSCIVLSTVVMLMGLHLHGIKNGAVLLNEPPPDVEAWDTFVMAMEHIFNAVFVTEFVVRLFFLRSRYFYDHRIQWFNMFDSMLVLLTVFEAYVLHGISLNVSFIRLLRIMRLLRALRLVRTVRFFGSLRVLVATVAASFMSLFWSMVLLVLVMIMAALSLSQLLSATVLDDENVSLEARTWVYRYYGTPARSFYTVFEMTFSGCWPNYARVLVEEVSWLYVIFFAIYIGAIVFSMLRIITALFLKDTLAIASTDADIQIQEKLAEKEKYAQKLRHFFQEIDSTGEGAITEDQFHAMLQEPRAAAYLAHLEIDPSESMNLFHIIDDGDGRISPEEFLRGALRLKGQARAQDLVVMLHELAKVKMDVNHVLELLASSTRNDLHAFHGNGARPPKGAAIEAARM